MRQFAELYWRLDGTTRTTEKVAALKDYFATVPAEDAACGLTVLCGARQTRAVPTKLLREWAAAAAGLPLWLLEECYAHVGDLAETLALVLPEQFPAPADPPAETTAPPRSLARCMDETILGLKGKPDTEKRRVVEATWRWLAPRERIVWHKLLTGGCRVGVSRTLVARALAELSGLEPAVLAERMMATSITTAADFEALLSNEPTPADSLRPYPFFLASPLDGQPDDLGPATDWQAEWKWDGMRAQLVKRGGTATIWSRGEERMSDAFPEIVDAAACLPDGTVLDGELLAARPDCLLSFAMLSRRASRKQVSKKLLAEIPAVFVAYDLLEREGCDLRQQPLSERRRHLVAIVPAPFERQPAPRGGGSAASPPPTTAGCRLFHSPVVAGSSWHDLREAREQARSRGVEGLMLKRTSSPYAHGRPRGDWWKWKVEPLEIDAVLHYAQAGHGRRAGLHTDYTLGVWDGDELVTIAKAYSGLSDKELVEIDKIIRATTVARHGPVRVVEPTLVFQLAFENVSRSTRHKSGIAVRFPRIQRWRRDKQPHEAASLTDLEALLAQAAGEPAEPSP
jgi:DNA ligase-1